MAYEVQHHAFSTSTLCGSEWLAAGPGNFTSGTQSRYGHFGEKARHCLETDDDFVIVQCVACTVLVYRKYYAGSCRNYKIHLEKKKTGIKRIRQKHVSQSENPKNTLTKKRTFKRTGGAKHKILVILNDYSLLYILNPQLINFTCQLKQSKAACRQEHRETLNLR
jgi:hypothetical protein